MDKKELLSTLQKNWDRFWKIDFLIEQGFKRQRCEKCGKFFWAIGEQKVCNDASCRSYEFINNPRTKRKFEYEEAWHAIRNFFVKNGHVEIPRYPVICRWFPLYFTIAGIVDFYRIANGKLDFEFPASNVVVLQPSLRFNDVANVGVTSRHWTIHSHVEQASLYDGKQGYWKERCIELDFNLLTRVFGIRPEEINFIEDVWLGAGAFGYSLEYHVAGLELGNAVFTEFLGTPSSYKPMEKKVIDMGAGLERFCWISKGSYTSYDAVFEREIKKLREICGIELDEDLFSKYCVLSSKLAIEDFGDIAKMWKWLGEKLNVDANELRAQIEPMQAIYAILDHTRALCFAICDGGVIGSAGAGYNLRFIARRAFSLISRFRFPITIEELIDLVVKRFSSAHPELKKSVDKIKLQLSTEKEKYEKNKRRARVTIENLLRSEGEITTEKLIELYDSHGISPEFLQEIAEKLGKRVEIPSDFYARVSARHEKRTEKKEDVKLVANLPKTEKLFYTPITRFKAKVLKVIDDEIVLDRSAFFPESGGQESDKGVIISRNGKCNVLEVREVNGVLLHRVDLVTCEEGETIECVIDEERRKKLRQHHTATHLLNYACRVVFGEHAWQHGARKGEDIAHLDITHFQLPSQSEIEKLEEIVKELIKKDIEVRITEMPRGEAERKFGFVIYQGGYPTSKRLRIVSIGDIEHEACCGLHCNRTSEVKDFIITDYEKVQDGLIRFYFIAGNRASQKREELKSIVNKLAKLLKVSEEDVIKAVRKLIERKAELEDELKTMRKRRAIAIIEKLRDEFTRVKDIDVLIATLENASIDELKEISRALSTERSVIVLLSLRDADTRVFISCGSESGISARELLEKTLQAISGKGGGDELLAQGYGKRVEDASSLMLNLLNFIKEMKE